MNNLFEAYTDGSCDNMNIYKAGGSNTLFCQMEYPSKKAVKDLWDNEQSYGTTCNYQCD